MKRIFVNAIAIICFAIALLFALPAQANQEAQFGGWVMDEKTIIQVTTDFNRYIRANVTQVLKFNEDGTPDTKLVNYIDYPFDGKSTIIGRYYCNNKTNHPGIISVYSPDENKVYKAWIYDGKKFTKIDEKTVTCNNSFVE
ncbi:MAG: hypothetical protein ACRC80_01075 [Waterburya sp.]